MFWKFYAKHKSELRHECELPVDDDIVVRYIYNGYFVRFRRMFRQLMMVNENCPITKVLMKSSTFVKNERYMHLKYHYYMIHPFSSFRFVWVCFMIMVYEILLHMNCAAVVDQTKYTYIIVLTVLDCFCLIDIVVNLNTGYQSTKTNKIIFSRGKVFRKYLPFMILSLVTTFSTQLFLLQYEYYDDVSISTEKTAEKRRFEIALYLKFLVIIAELRYISRLREYKQYSEYKFSVIKGICFVRLVVMLGTFILLETRRTSSLLWKHHLIIRNELVRDCFVDVVKMLLLMGRAQGLLPLGIAIVEIIIFFFGFILQLLVTSLLLLFVMRYHSSINKFHLFIQQVDEFCRFKFLPESIRLRMHKYFNFRFQETFYSEPELLGILSHQLRQEMLVHMYMNMFDKVRLFEDLPLIVICKMIKNMQSEIYLPADVVVTAGTFSECMFFLLNGTVAVFSPTGKEVCHLTDGANFGEVTFVLESEQRVATIVAIDCCEIYILHRKVFLNLIANYPELHARMIKTTRDRIKKSVGTGSDDEEQAWHM